MDTPLPFDSHTHTWLCKHAHGTPADYARMARARGLPGIYVTDHVPTPNAFQGEVRMTNEQFTQYLDMVAAAQAEFGAAYCRLGIEADYYPGCEDWLPDWLAAQPFDLVLGSIHYVTGWNVMGQPPPTEDTAALWRDYFAQVATLARTGWYDVVAHLDVPKRWRAALPADWITTLAGPALEALAANDMAVELNTSGFRHPINEIYPAADLLAALRARGIGIVFGSDAHHPEQVGTGFQRALALARAVGYREYRVYRQRTYTLEPLARPAPPPPGI
ncbi:MAG: histidinol-phosphatase HisJ family protein [Candidatus Marinimicrobia bacterium]|nr:histidinol-phosphatase HisJ family protein [Candidatus Neomarinimicrobiota bacterium]